MKKEIELINVEKTFNKSNLVLNNINLTIEKNSIFCLLGPNGAGKTTMIRIINGLLKESKGKVFLFGNELTKETRKYCGIVTGSSSCYESMSAYENLVFFGSMYGVKDLEMRIDTLSEKLNMKKYLHNKVTTFSTGMKKKLMIAIGLIHKPKILFLDEPTSSLDPQGAKEILDLICDLVKNEDVTILIATHYLDYAEKIGSSFGVLKNGSFIANIDKKDCKNELKKGWLEDFYFKAINKEI